MKENIRHKIINKINKLQPTQIMIIGFALIILLGTLLLSLPVASQNGKSTNFLTALFTSTSAVCVTGLAVVDTGTHWSLFGQAVILLLIQVGGLGFMAVATLFVLIAKKKVNLKERLLIQESLNQFNLSGLTKLTKQILIITFTAELLGTLFLSTEFVPKLGLFKGLWFSIFHSVSAFCNAGFDIMGEVSGPFTSLTSFVNNYTVSATISLLILLGGIGFPVIVEILKCKKNKNFKRISVHSRIVLKTTAFITILSTILLMIVEFHNYKTIGNFSFNSKILASLFQSVTARTAGFNTYDLSLMTGSGIFIMIILMFIGASPVSTGGGVKTTTLMTIILYVKSSILEKEDVEIYGRRLDENIVRKSMGIFFIFISLVTLGTLAISITQPEFSLIESWFEVMSAITTAGLSIGGSLNLNVFGKLLIILFMFIGRVGSLTIFIAFISKKTKNRLAHIRYPEEKILVG